MSICCGRARYGTLHEKESIVHAAYLQIYFKNYRLYDFQADYGIYQAFLIFSGLHDVIGIILELSTIRNAYFHGR